MVMRAAAARRLAGRARRTTWRERSALAQALVYVAVVDLALRARGFGWLAPRLRGPVDAQDTAALDRVRAMAQAIERAARLYPAHAACLHRAAALQLWLRRSGAASVLRIGVRKDGNDLRAHAWVEIDGHVLHDDATAVAHFSPIFTTWMLGLPQAPGGMELP